jgi:hypothetical protein
MSATSYNMFYGCVRNDGSYFEGNNLNCIALKLQELSSFLAFTVWSYHALTRSNYSLILHKDFT